MEFLNIEIKARCHNPSEAESRLMGKGADFKGTDLQTDTYYKVDHGRLKLREGDIENALIHYDRPNQSGPKKSGVTLYKTQDKSLKTILDKSLGHLVVVKKTRKIFFIDNVKFHLDHVEGLGDFLEIEAIDYEGTIGQERLMEQCEQFMELLDVAKEDLLAVSYSDMMLNYE